MVVQSVSQLHRQASCAAPERTFLDEGEGEKSEPSLQVNRNSLAHVGTHRTVRSDMFKSSCHTAAAVVARAPVFLFTRLSRPSSLRELTKPAGCSVGWWCRASLSSTGRPVVQLLNAPSWTRGEGEKSEPSLQVNRNSLAHVLWCNVFDCYPCHCTLSALELVVAISAWGMPLIVC